MRPTIYTVAEEAGVSIATVSRVLNDSTRVSAATRDKVQRAMESLGYQPNASARGLAGNTTNTIALIFPKVSGPFFSALIQGAETEASASGYHLLIYGAAGQMLQTDNQTLGVLTTKVDGLILASSGVSECYLRDLRRRDLPVVVMGEVALDPPVDSIIPDNMAGAEKITTHLIGHGYQRIAMIGGPESSTHAGEREQGYRRALRAHGQPYHPDLTTTGNYEESGGYAAMKQLLQIDPLPDAVFAASDQMAIGAMAAIHEAGLHIPDDIALVGFDDIEAARYMTPPLTTVHQDMLGQGQLAVRMLLARINGLESDVETKILPSTLVIRRSCGCMQDDDDSFYSAAEQEESK